MDLLEGIQRFRQRLAADSEEASLFERLATGQAPKDLFIGCSDSRVVPDLITSAKPGDRFVIRNAGNLIPPYDLEHPSAAQAAIDFAMVSLKVKRVVVCGHSDCGALKGLMDAAALAEHPMLKRWMEPYQPLLKEIAGLPKKEGLRKLTERNVRLQLEHVRSHPLARPREEAGQLEIMGWIYDIGSGAVDAWSESEQRFIEINAPSPAPEV